jgi:mRNA-degrading endonuclease RelE of RelBE toxin-antitoxin system
MHTFVETPLFTRLVSEYLTDEEYAALQSALAANPESGELIRGSGGLRKLRWSGSGRGKRGGVRVIYYLRNRAGVIWMLTIYTKNVSEGIPVDVLRKIAREIEDD